MSLHNFLIRPLLLSEIEHFIDANIQAGFISSNPKDIACLKKAITLAEHIALLETDKKIKGGVMLFRRWHNAIWATNIFVDASIQAQGASIALYKYTVHYCVKKVPWLFCNPINRIISLHKRWGIVPINYWESISLVAMYNYFYKENSLDIVYPFHTTCENNILQAENQDIVMKLIINQKFLQVLYKHRGQILQHIALEDAYLLRLDRMPSYVKLTQDWSFDYRNGLISHEKKQITIYAPTASSQSLLGITIPIDDVKKPTYWNYANNELQVIYTVLKKDIQVELVATFNQQSITLAINAPKNYHPRLTIVHDVNSMIHFTEHPKVTIETVKYQHCSHTIYNGITHKLVAHLIDTAPIHKKFLRTFIPRSHRPYIGGSTSYGSSYTLPLAAKLLDLMQRKLFMNTPYALLELSEEGNRIFQQIKTDLYGTKF